MRQFVPSSGPQDRPAAHADRAGAERHPAAARPAGRLGRAAGRAVCRRRDDFVPPAFRRGARPSAPQSRDRARTCAEGVRDLRVRLPLSRRNHQRPPRTSRSARTKHPIPSGLRAMTVSMPQLRDLWIIGTDGYPLVSGTVFPMPRIDLSDRELFQGPPRQRGERSLCHRGAGRPRRQHQVSSRSAASARSTAGSPASPSFRSRRSISASSIPSCRRPGPRHCCAPTARCWRAIRKQPAASNACRPIRRSSRLSPSTRSYRAGHRRRPLSTAASVSSCTSDWRSCPIFTLRSASKPTP